jgi:hypothetical protein
VAAICRGTIVKTSVPCVFAAGLFFLLLTGQARGQASAPDPEQRSSSSSALQFTIGPDFQLASFHGSLLSWQHQLSRTRAYRIGIGIGGSLGNSDGAGDDWSYRLDSDSTALDSAAATNRTSSDMKSFNLDLVSQYLWQHNHGRPVMFYWGVGPSFHYSRNRSQSSWDETSFATGSRTEVRRMWGSQSNWRLGAGVSSTAGAEWRVTAHLSLLAEYRASAQYTYLEADTHDRTVLIRSEAGHRVSEEVRTMHSRPISRSAGVGSEGVWLGVSAYF